MQLVYFPKTITKFVADIHKKYFTIWYHDNHYYGKKKREVPRIELRNQLTPTDVKLQTVIASILSQYISGNNNYWRVNKKCCENVCETRDDTINLYAIVIKTVAFSLSLTNTWVKTFIYLMPYLLSFYNY